MMSLNVILLLFGAVLVAADIPNANCPNYWTAYGDKCFRYYSEAKLEWSDAELECQVQGGHLASIESSGENSAISQLIGKDTWIGLNDRHTEKDFKWTDGTSYKYKKWDSGEPNNIFNEDCVAMRTDGAWEDRDCNNNFYFACSRDALKFHAIE